MLHRKFTFPPLLHVSVTELPLHIAGLSGVIFIIGAGNPLIVTDAVLVQPLRSVTVTVYVFGESPVMVCVV